MNNTKSRLPGWKSLSLETAFHTPVFDLLVERSECVRTGASTNFYYFKCPDWVNVIAMTPDNKIVMIRQYRHGKGTIELEIPGGGMNPSENHDPVSAGARELLEETGFAVEKGVIIGKVCPNPALQGNTCYTVFFQNARQVSKPDMEATEEIETALFPVEELDDFIKKVKIMHGLVLNALHFFDIWKKDATKTS